MSKHNDKLLFLICL